MFLKDLFRYRTTGKENREDFLSSCLAELMRRDADACEAVLSAVKLTTHPPLTDGYVVRTQVGKHHAKKMRWCDVMVEFIGHDPLIIECKVGDSPKVQQVKRYQQLWDTKHVALLAPVSSVPPKDSKPWHGIPRGSWQAVWEAIEGLPKSKPHTPFRKALLDLMTHLELAGCPHRSTADLQEVEAAWSALQPLRRPMRQAVLHLLADKTIPLGVDAESNGNEGKTKPVWGDGSPLNAYWERDAARDGTKLLGLGLDVRECEGVGSADLDWYLSLYPSPTLEPKMAKLSKTEHGWTSSYGWYERVLGDTGGPDTTFAEQLERAVKEARLWLQQDVVGERAGRGRIAIEVPVGRGRDVSQYLALTEGWDSAMRAWSLRLMQHVQETLSGRVKKPFTVRPVSDSVRLFRGKAERFWAGWEWDIEGEPHWGLILGWATVAEREAGLALLDGAAVSAGIETVRSGKYGQSYRLKLADHTGLEDAYKALSKTADALLNHDGLAVLGVGAALVHGSEVSAQ